MSATFPTLIPTARVFNPGNYPVKAYQAMNGVEHRLLYGSNRTGMTLQLTYANITDTEAASFLEHFEEMKGTLFGFSLGQANEGAKAGYTGSSTFGINANGGKWRYEKPPTMTSVKPGVSTVNLTLRGFF